MVIPADWKEVRLGEIAEIVSGGTPSTAIGSYWGGDIPWCTPTDITSCKSSYLFDTERKITPAGLAGSAASLLPPGSLLLCTRATVGDVRIAGRAIATNQGFKSLVVNSQANSKFVYFVLQTLRQAMIEKSSGSTFLELGKNDLSNIVALMPPLKEQEAIAEALSDADAAIESLDALIAKKRDVKQAAMQQLLTGRTRLPGFNADWKEVRLGEICELSLAASKKSRSDGRGKYIIADMGSVSKDGSFLTHKTTDVREDVLRTGDLVMPKDDIGGGQIIGKAVLVDEDERYVLGDHVYRLRLSDGLPAFVRYGINSYQVNIQLRSKVVGSAQLGLGRRAVLEQPISFPPLKEQEAIAEALTVMDDELEALNEQVSKLRMVKEGMMQDLLTGKVRLV